MKHLPVLFVGNSPNQLVRGNSSWSDLMAFLCGEEKGHEEVPFTLRFEELLCRHRKRGLEEGRTKSQSDKAFRERIVNRMNGFQPHPVHKRLMTLRVENVLTTNYDFNLERAITATPKLGDWGTKESRYSLFRRWAAGKKFVFHIHGDIQKPRTIMLGHEAYVDSCANIRRFSSKEVRNKDGKKEKSLGIPYKVCGPIKAKFREKKEILDPKKAHSWVDLFMLRDVHIVGFGLDFTEVDIWYLISYKARLKYENDVPDDLRTSNIFFHYFAEQSEKHRQKVAMLESFGLICQPHEITLKDNCHKDYEGAWDGLLKHLSEKLRH